MKRARILAVLLTAVAATALLMVACSDSAPTTSPQGVEQAGPSFEIYDAAHAGDAGFYFLPPLVPDPQATGVFDPSFLPYTTVRICELGASGCLSLGEYTSTTGIGAEVLRIPDGEQHYIVNWHTDQFSLDEAKTYRIEVEVGGFMVGYADVDVVTSGRELRNVETGQYVALKDGRTLPIKFRIEDQLPGMAVVTPEGGTVASQDGGALVEVPSGALTEDRLISVSHVPVTDPVEGYFIVPGTTYALEPDGLQFVFPARITLAYDASTLPEDIDPSDLIVLRVNSAGDVFEAIDGSVDPESGHVSGLIEGFSKVMNGRPDNAGFCSAFRPDNDGDGECNDVDTCKETPGPPLYDPVTGDVLPGNGCPFLPGDGAHYKGWCSCNDGEDCVAGVHANTGYVPTTFNFCVWGGTLCGVKRWNSTDITVNSGKITVHNLQRMPAGGVNEPFEINWSEGTLSGSFTGPGGSCTFNLPRQQ